MPTKDPAIRAKHNRTYYEKNKAAYRVRNQVVRDRNSQYIRDLKSNTPCLDCNKQYHWFVMDFDHVRGQKINDISKMAIHSLVSLEKLKEEIAKCEIVCSNCHRLRTYSRAL